MAKSLKKVLGHYHLCGASPSKGKKITSRMIRRKVRQQLKLQGEEFDFFHKQDRKRGKKGSRCDDYGWLFFGDGYARYFYGGNPFLMRLIDWDRTEWDEEFQEWLLRKTRK